ncbi:MAG: hypothetical protein IKO65_00535, partial [Victivallales bacterium]|nr:hypothetical protein [Victivallales bacterium]
RSLDGKIGPFTASKSAPPSPCSTLQDFFEYFLGPVRPEGKLPKAILNPLDYGSCLIESDSITIDDSVKELPAHDYFLPFVSSPFPMLMPIPIIEGKCDGKPMRFCFDTGMRMALIDDSFVCDGKENQGTIKEWIPIPNIHRYVDVPYYPADFEFGEGFHFKGHVEIDNQGQYIKMATGGGLAGFNAFFGKEICEQFNVFISSIPGKRGVAIINKNGKGKTEKTHCL